jgi:hypothetical protein
MAVAALSCQWSEWNVVVKVVGKTAAAKAG